MRETKTLAVLKIGFSPEDPVRQSDREERQKHLIELTDNGFNTMRFKVASKHWVRDSMYIFDAVTFDDLGRAKREWADRVADFMLSYNCPVETC